jgi:hypothetical protein
VVLQKCLRRSGLAALQFAVQHDKKCGIENHGRSQGDFASTGRRLLSSSRRTPASLKKPLAR